jgi:hypothetical protein
MSTKDNDPQPQLFAELAELARSLGNAHRLMLLEHIARVSERWNGWRHLPG